MPTFTFFYEGGQRSSFQGADQRQLQATTADLARRAERAGTYVNRTVTAADLARFYTEHDAAKVGHLSNVLSA